MTALIASIRARHVLSAAVLASASGFLLISMFLPACSSIPGAASQAAQSKPAAPPANILAADVIAKPLPVQIRSFGNVEPYASVALKSQVAGMLTELHFKEGQPVESNALLANIDPRTYQAAAQAAQANHDRDTVYARRAEAEYRRVEALFKKGAATKDEEDAAKAAWEALLAAVQADKANLENAKIQLGYCEIRSPITGQLGTLLMDRGNLVKINDLPIVIINQMKPIYVSFTVPQQYLPTIRKYMAQRPLPVQTTLPMEAQNPEQGSLTFVDNNIDLATGTIRLRATFPNANMRLWPGQFVNVVLDLTTEADVVVVPSQAIQSGQKGTYVYTIDSNLTAHEQLVKIGRTQDGLTVIEQGLKPGQKVVTDGHLRLTEGTPVVIRTGLATGAASPVGAAGGPASAPAGEGRS